MKHRIPTIVALVATAVAVAVPATAHAHRGGPDVDNDRRPCVDTHEFNRAKPGDSKTWVRRVFDTRGHEADRRTANAIYNDLAYYGVTLPRLPMRYREVRVYPVCADGKIVDGVVTTVFDRRGHRQIVSEMETQETSGKVSAVR